MTASVGRQRRSDVLRGCEKADVAIVGGGLSGLTTALWLGRAGFRVVVVEAETIGYGSSSVCGGILSPGRKCCYARMEKRFGPKTTEAYAYTHQKALAAIKELQRRQQLYFDLYETTGTIIMSASEECESMEQEAAAMKRAGLSATVAFDHRNNPAIKIKGVYVLKTEAYLAALAEYAETSGVRIFEHSRVIGVETDLVYTDTGSVSAPFVVIATGYPIINIPGWYFIWLEQRRGRRFAEKNEQMMEEVTLSSNGSFNFWQENSYSIMQTFGEYVGTDKNDEQEWRSWMNRRGATDLYPEREGIECFTPDDLPYIGNYSGKTPNLFVATGYGGDGVLGSMIAAQAISARVLGLCGEEYQIYDPLRRMKEPPSASVRLCRRYLKSVWGGENAPRCSHMGCRLVWNHSARLWECPCHGSRFDGIGRVINAPAVRSSQLGRRK